MAGGSSDLKLWLGLAYTHRRASGAINFLTDFGELRDPREIFYRLA